MNIEELPVVTENQLLIELVKQYGQLSTEYVACSRNYCLPTEARIKFLEELIKKVTDDTR